MKISVIVPTYNRLARLRHVIKALENQDIALDQFEVLVVSDGSGDGTNEYLQTLKTPLRLRPLIQHNQGAAVARNTGVANANGDILLFVDDDVVPTPSLVREHFYKHENAHSPVVVLGPMLSPSDFSMLPWVEWEQAMLMKQYQAMQKKEWEPTARQFYTGNTSLDKSLILKAGGFDPTFRRAEDVELAYRLVKNHVCFIFHPGAVGYHYAERSFESWLATPYAYGKNDIIFYQQKGQDWLLPTIKKEYPTRNIFVRILVQLCLDQPVLSNFVITGVKRIAVVCHRLGARKLSNMAFSGIFNLRYYQGIADQLGGAKNFLRGVLKKDDQAV